MNEVEKINYKVPPIKSQGKKTKLIEWIENQVKDMDKNKELTFVEPFVGTGAVGFNIAGKNAIFADSNIHLINFYNAIKSGEITAKKVREYLKIEGKKLEESGEGKDSHYYVVRERFNKDFNSLDFLFLTRSCFNGMMRFNSKGHFNVPFCKKPERFAPALITKISNQVLWLEMKIKTNNWEFVCSDFRTFMKSIAERTDIVMYLDPPYIGLNSDYYNTWKPQDEEDMGNLLKETKNSFILSTWYSKRDRENPYVKSHWSEYNIIKRNHFYHVGGKIENRSPVVEALIVSNKVKEYEHKK